ncbi:outer membrane protein assembly factor BamA [Myxococcota bacterium]|nr:outer membrane protein assembly factor BamA [Myxococcota bacterium]
MRRGGWVAVCGALWMLAPCGPVPAAMAEEAAATAPGPVVVEIRFDGLLRIDAETARRRIHSRTGQPLDPDTVTSDLKTLFGMGAFENLSAAVEPADGGVRLVFRVEERPAVDRVRLEGNDEVKEDDLRKKLTVRPASILDIERVEQSAEALRAHYVEQGFYLAEVTFRLDPRPNRMVDVVFVIREHAKVRVQRIEFLGNEHVPSEDIKKFMQTQEGSLLSFLTGKGTFQKEALEQDVQRIAFFLNTRGYAQARVSEPIVTLSRDRRFITITIPIEEGPQYRVGQVRVTGDLEGTSEADLLPRLALKPGEIFNALNVQKDIQTLGDFWKDQGYAFATVSNDTDLHPDTRLLDFTYILQRGDTARFGRIDIVGNEGTRDWTIRRELRIYEGDLYSESKLRDSEARIRRLGFFETVSVTPRPGPRPGEVDVTVEVKERQTGAFSVGAGFSSLENFLFQAQVSKQNFLGRGQNIRLEATLSSLRRFFVFSFDEPYLFDTDWTFGFSAYNTDISQYNFYQASKGLDFTFGRRFADFFSVALTYKLEGVNVRAGGYGLKSSSDVPVANLDQVGLTSSLTLTGAFDNRDDRMFPTRGNVSSISLEWAGSEIGSDFDYMRINVRSRQYFPIIWGIVGKVAGSWGYIFSPKGRPVPIFERFQVGGIFTVRGFERASLGPSVPVGSSRDPSAWPSPFKIGGAQQLILNVEAEFPIFQTLGIRGVVFFDAGNAYDDGEWPNPLKMRPAAGFGIRWWSPIGPLRFEWGFPLKRQTGEPPVVFEFNIGSF